MRDQLFHEILMARQRVYAVCEPTPLEPLDLPELDAEVFVKREDLSPIHSYKWRGAYNKMATLTPADLERGVIAASAGNHAQGVALAARRMNAQAKIVMPLSTPRMKQSAVREFGGDNVEVILHGDSYSEAAAEAARLWEAEGRSFIHPYDDLLTMGGQGTLADEAIMSGEGPFDVAYLQIGGGGMAAAVACWLKTYLPNIRVVGVEGVEQASMRAAFDAGRPVDLDYVDVFADGSAVKRAGDKTYPLCRELLDDLITVTNEELCAAIQLFWERKRSVPEPAGAMGLAGLLQQRDRVQGRRALCVVCGANLDFAQLSWIARHAGIGAARRRYYRFEIREERGQMLRLFDAFGGANIIEMQYGKTDERRAWPVIGLEAPPTAFEEIQRRLEAIHVPWEDVTSKEDVEFRVINYEPALFRDPFLFRVEFPERAGALRDFMRRVQGLANMCYFNYVFSGENIGRALLGFEFDSSEHQTEFRDRLRQSGLTWREIQPDAFHRILG